MSLYAEYILETTDWNIWESDKGFFTAYVIEDTTILYCEDFHIAKAYRNTLFPFRMGCRLRELAMDLGCSQIMTSVDPESRGAVRAVRHLVKWGFKQYGEDQGNILYIRDVHYGKENKKTS